MGLKEKIPQEYHKKWYEAKQKYIKGYKKISYSQGGEDLILDQLVGYKEKGFFIDVGAHDPIRYSNTFMFYKRGWRGINIDPLPGMASKFKAKRPEDISVELGVSSEEGKLEYFMHNEPALNGFSKELSEGRTQGTEYDIIKTIEVPTKPLSVILEQHLKPSNRTIDFMNVDTEGFDLVVLKSNNWELFRPNIIITETLNAQNVEEALDDEVTKFLKSKGYKLKLKLFSTAVYLEGAFDI